MKCLICGNEIASDKIRCSICKNEKSLSAYSSIFQWSYNDTQKVNELKRQYLDIERVRQEEIRIEEQKRIREENRKLEEERIKDQKKAEERKVEEVKKVAEQGNEHKKPQNDIDGEINSIFDKIEEEESLKKPKKKRNIIIGIIVFLIACGIISNIEEEFNHRPPEQIESNDYTETNAYNSTGETVVEYINNEWDNNRVALNNWEVPIKTYERYIENCKSFTLEFSISDVIDGNPYGVWIVYLRDKDGVWNEITTFAHARSNGEEASSWEIKAENTFKPFNAIALARKGNDSSNHSFWYDTKNFVIAD